MSSSRPPWAANDNQNVIIATSHYRLCNGDKTTAYNYSEALNKNR